jgi:hypothetical protein
VRVVCVWCVWVCGACVVRVVWCAKDAHPGGWGRWVEPRELRGAVPRARMKAHTPGRTPRLSAPRTVRPVVGGDVVVVRVQAWEGGGAGWAGGGTKGR